MTPHEKLKRVLQDDWEIHGDPKQLCLILREQLLKRRLTADEKKVMDDLVDMWNGYVKLPSSSADPTCREVQNAVHVIQGVLAARVAARCEPDFWRVYDDERGV